MTCNFSTWEVEAGESIVQDHSQLHSNFEASLGYVRPFSKDLRERERKKITVSLILFHSGLGVTLWQTCSLCTLSKSSDLERPNEGQDMGVETVQTLF